jgi:hypothetical protein
VRERGRSGTTRNGDPFELRNDRPPLLPLRSTSLSSPGRGRRGRAAHFSPPPVTSIPRPTGPADPRPTDQTVLGRLVLRDEGAAGKTSKPAFCPQCLPSAGSAGLVGWWPRSLLRLAHRQIKFPDPVHLQTGVRPTRRSRWDGHAGPTDRNKLLEARRDVFNLEESGHRNAAGR